MYTYADLFTVGKLVSTLGAYCIGIGMLVLLYGVVSSWRHGERAPANPWGAKTLEWTVPNLIPLENFEVLPVVTSDAYGYGEGDYAPSRDPDRPDIGPSLKPAYAGFGSDTAVGSGPLPVPTNDRHRRRPIACGPHSRAALRCAVHPGP